MPAITTTAVTGDEEPPSDQLLCLDVNNVNKCVDRQNSATSANLSSSFKNEAIFVLQQPIDSCMLNDDRGKDEEEYLEKVQETSCPVSLTDEKHKDVLMRRLTTLRRNREFCDVVLYADNREIFCHKVVLAALSPRFYEMFAGAPTPPGAKLSQSNGIVRRFANDDKSSHTSGTGGGDLPLTLQDQVHPGVSQVVSDRLAYYEFKDIDYDSLEAIVGFAYSGRLEITNDRVAQLYKAAFSLRVQTCVKACADYLLKALNTKNCIGLRKCANKTNDLLLGNQIDLFIQKHFADIVCESTEFTSLPCIQVDVFVSNEDRSKMLKNGRKIGEKVMDWLQRETAILPEHVEFRMELLTGRPYILYLDAEAMFQDCNDLEDSSSVGSSDLVQDYKKHNRLYAKKSKTHVCCPLLTNSVSPTSSLNNNSNNPANAVTCNGNGVSNNGGSCSAANAVNTTASVNGRLFRMPSNESVNSIASDHEECEWKLIAVSKNSENYYVLLSIVKRKLAAISIHVNDAPFFKPGVTDRLALLLAKSQDAAAAATAATVEAATAASAAELLATMSDHRCNVGAVCLDGRVIVCGGNNRGECLKTVESFDIANNKWFTLAPMLKERGRFGACVCNGKVYAVGGSDGQRDLNTCECYDPSTNCWTRLADFTTAPKSSNMAASANGVVFSIGGFDGQAARRTCEAYDPMTDAWRLVAPMSTARYQAGCASWQDTVIIVGGCDTWSCLSSAEIYQPESNTWRPLPSMIAPRRGCGATVLNGKLYVAGGSDGSQTLCSVEVLDLEAPNLVWRPGPQMNMPRGNVRLVAADRRVYAVGGFSGKLFTNTIEYLEEGASEWCTTVGLKEAPAPLFCASLSPTSLGTLLSNSTIDEDTVGEADDQSSTSVVVT